MQQAENYGFGKTLHYDDLTEETFSSTLNDLLSNPKYVYLKIFASYLLF